MISAQKDAYNKRARLKLRYINHPGKVAQLGLSTRPMIPLMPAFAIRNTEVGLPPLPRSKKYALLYLF